MKHLPAQIARYVPETPQEEADKQQFLAWLQSGQDLLCRENLTAHLTASAWVVSPDRKYVLMAYHNLYDSWAWLGGHADGDADLLQVALREAREESGVQELRVLSEEPISLEVLCVNGHEKRGAYVPSHLHLNVTYLLEADFGAALHNRPEENQAVAWIEVDEIANKSTEPWFVERIYSKLVQKTAREYPADTSGQ